MSMVHCDQCERLIDSDDDPECFVDVGNMRSQHKMMVFCDSCRDVNEWARERVEQNA